MKENLEGCLYPITPTAMVEAEMAYPGWLIIGDAVFMSLNFLLHLFEPEFSGYIVGTIGRNETCHYLSARSKHSRGDTPRERRCEKASVKDVERISNSFFSSP